MNTDLETDATASMVSGEGNTGASAGASGGSGRGAAGDGGTNAHIQFRDPDGSSFDVNISGNAPNMQVGHHNIMHVTGSKSTQGKTSHQKTPIKAKKPLISSTDIPGTQSMDIVATNIGKDWRNLGRALGISDGELDNLKLDYHQEGQYEVSYQLIRKWKSATYPAELKALAIMCNNIGRGDISDKLSDMLRDGKL